MAIAALQREASCYGLRLSGARPQFGVISAFIGLNREGKTCRVLNNSSGRNERLSDRARAKSSRDVFGGAPTRLTRVDHQRFRVCPESRTWVIAPRVRFLRRRGRRVGYRG